MYSWIVPVLSSFGSCKLPSHTLEVLATLSVIEEVATAVLVSILLVTFVSRRNIKIRKIPINSFLRYS